ATPSARACTGIPNWLRRSSYGYLRRRVLAGAVNVERALCPVDPYAHEVVAGNYIRESDCHRSCFSIRIDDAISRRRFETVSAGGAIRRRIQLVQQQHHALCLADIRVEINLDVSRIKVDAVDDTCHDARGSIRGDDRPQHECVNV